MQSQPSRRLRVAVVVASLRILGGQAVQADRILTAWRDDPAVHAWLVPINPVPPWPFDRLLRIKYVRTVITQLCYWPLLFRELAKADVVHIFSASYSSFLLAPLPAIVVSRLLRKPVLLNYHSGEAPDHLSRSRLARLMLRRHVDLNVVPSPFLRGVLARFGIGADVVANTVDSDEFAFRQRDLRIRPLTLLSTRNFEPLYNVACTLRAFAVLQTRYPDVRLILVGGGSEEPALRALAEGLSLRNVTFTGRVPPCEISRHYAAADIYVQTPNIDNMPLSVLEAFACGLPVVSTRVGGIPAILADGVHGLLAPDNDHEAVAARLIELIEHPDQAKQLAMAAHATCARYQWKHVREAWLAAYGKLVPDAAPAGRSLQPQEIA